MPTPSENAAADVLGEIGFEVSRIPTAVGQKRADFRAANPTEGHIVEVKTKDDDPTQIEKHLHTLSTEGAAIRSTPMGRTNTMSGVYREAVSQLRATPSLPEDFKLIWFMAIGRDQDVQVRQFQDTLYGTVPIIVPTSPIYGSRPLRGFLPQSTAKMIPCYFFAFNEFYTAKDIDGAVVGTEAGIRLCVNCLARRAPEFRRTKLHEFFADHNAVCDPPMLESAGRAFVADCDIDRREELQVLQFVRAKYELARCVIPFHGTRHVGEAVVGFSTR